MKSIKAKIALLVMLCTILASASVGVLSIQNARKLIREDSTRLMNQACENSAQKMDAVISRIGQSVETLADCALNTLDDVGRFQTDSVYVEAYTGRMENVLMSAAQNTEGTISAYLRFNPDFTEPTSGLFLTGSGNGSFDKVTPTDFSIYDKSDTAHVGWYYIPVENRSATWMSPYMNENLNIYMISYVVPLYKDDVEIGIIGMDIDFGLIQRLVDETAVYKTGYAFLTDQENRIMYHKTLPVNQRLEDISTDGSMDGLCGALSSERRGDELIAYEYEGAEKKMAYQELQNGMRLVLTAPLAEINESANRLIYQIIGFALAATAVSIFVALLMIRSVTKPVEELNRAAGKIADGDLNVEVSCRSRDEIGTLAQSIGRTAARLKSYVNYIEEISAVLDEIADGNLVFELRYEYEGEFARIKKSLRHISSSLNHTLLEINQACEQVAGGAGQVAAGAQALSQGAAQQAASVQELSGTIHEITEQVGRNAGNAQQAYSLAAEAGQAVEESSRHMKEMTAAMADIAETSDKIHRIVKTVEDIALQTNILALNASVEAARAGEAGRGFAIVAGEVGSLSDKVGAATKDIAELVSSATAAIGRGTAIVGKTEQSLKIVVEKSSVIEKTTQEIAVSSEGQVSALHRIDQGIEQISAVVSDNSSAAEEDAAASEEMSGQAQLLRGLIEHFKLDEEDRSYISE